MKLWADVKGMPTRTKQITVNGKKSFEIGIKLGCMENPDLELFYQVGDNVGV